MYLIISVPIGFSIWFLYRGVWGTTLVYCPRRRWGPTPLPAPPRPRARPPVGPGTPGPRAHASMATMATMATQWPGVNRCIHGHPVARGQCMATMATGYPMGHGYPMGI